MQLTLTKLVVLALSDAVNPCALAVLSLILLTILSRDPSRRRRVLWAGLSFSGAVYGMYLVYGLVIIRFFQLMQILGDLRTYLHWILGGVAVLLGILNIKDFFTMRPGGFATEMPLIFRPKVRRLILSITGPAGAFGTGIFVTLFLLPCTIGPYVVAGGILSVQDLISALPYLLLYNLIFVSPMLAITLLVYLGMGRVKDVDRWREEHLHQLHLIAGGLLLFIGVAMLFGFL